MELSTMTKSGDDEGCSAGVPTGVSGAEDSALTENLGGGDTAATVSSVALVKRAGPSEVQIAANRRNAAKSTGPRTLTGKRRAALNSLENGRYSSIDAWISKTMLKLREDPEAWRRRRQELLDDWRPLGVAETMLVEDLGNLYWEKAWLRRAKAARQLQKAETNALGREREALRARSEPFDLERTASISGLRRAREDSSDKFQETLRLLDELADRVARRAWGKDAGEVFRLLYDWHPTRLGVEIKALFECLGRGEAPVVKPLEFVARGRRGSRAAGREMPRPGVFADHLRPGECAPSFCRGPSIADNPFLIGVCELV